MFNNAIIDPQHARDETAAGHPEGGPGLGIGAPLPNPPPCMLTSSPGMSPRSTWKRSLALLVL